ncbi:MAG: hypothetical protein ACRD1Z_00870 [Vicinamibacteria bacterium]
MSGTKPVHLEDAIILDLDGSLVVRFSKAIEGRIYEAVFEPEALFELALAIGQPAEIPGEKKGQVVSALAVSADDAVELIECAEAEEDETEAESAVTGGAPRGEADPEAEPEIEEAEVLDVKPEPKRGE